MGNAPVFGRRGTSQGETALPRLADLPPLEPSLDDDEELAAWKAAHKQNLNETRKRWLYGWGGLGLLAIFVSALLRHFGLDILGLVVSSAGLYCFYRGYRASKA